MKALIVGGGIAGPVAAMALQKNGIEATVLEARPQSDGEVGSYFTLSPNGLHALDLVDALPLAKSAGFATRRNIMLGATGRELGTISLGRPLGDGTTAITMKRSRLAALLTQEARRRGIDVHFGARAASVSADADGASATLENRTELFGDVVIGADGVHSLVRRTIDPNAPKGRYVGLTNFGGITRRTTLAATLPPESWQFVFGRKAFFGCHPTPAGDVVWFVNVPRDPISPEERAARSHGQWQAWLADLLADDDGPGRVLVEAGQLELVADNTHDLGHVPVWHRDRMVVIGDAAHAPAPSSGQGASMALEDAVVLATSLRDCTRVPEGLATFEQARRRRVEKIVAVGARSSSAKIPGPVGRVVQEAVMKVLFRHVITDSSQEWITGHRVTWDSPATAGPQRSTTLN